MENKDIKEANNLLEAVENCSEVKPFDAVTLVENALLSFLEFRLKKLQEDLTFQDEIRLMIKARMPEADFNDLRVLLNQEQSNMNSVAFRMLEPFNQRMSDPKARKNSAEEVVFNDSNKDNLQGFNEMFQMLNSMKALMLEKKDNAKLKKALTESVEEVKED